MQIEIKKTGINGEGIGYLNRIPVFIDRALIGETIDAQIIESYPKYKVGIIKSIIRKSEERINPICPNYDKCDGCSLMHTTYNNQLEIKKSLLKEGLEKYAGIDIGDIQIEESKNNLYYRNCLKLPVISVHGKLKTAIYVKNSNNVWAIDKCLIHSKLLEELKNQVLVLLNKYSIASYDKKTKNGIRYLVLREIGNRAHMCLITGDDKIPVKLIEELNNIKEIVSIYQCINTSKNSVNIFTNRMIHLAGNKHLSFKIDNLKFNLSVKAFYQLNSYQAVNMYHYVNSLIEDNQSLIVEAYCGIGAMSLLATNKAKKIVGIEYVNDAVVNANKNAYINGIVNVNFVCGDSSEVMRKMFSKTKIDTLIVDPPRSGLDENMINAILNTDIANIIYVSCNPATLGKNLNILLKEYKMKSIRAFDMFSQTAHVEAVCLLAREGV